MHDHDAAVVSLYAIVDELDARGPHNARDLVDLWLDVEAGHGALGVVVRQLALDAALAVADANAAEGRPARADFVSATGAVVHLDRGYSTEKWRGHALAEVLGRDLIDRETGEVVRAVPVETFRRAVPGCADPELTSSRWRVTGLQGIDLDRYRTRAETPDVIRRGATRHR